MHRAWWIIGFVLITVSPLWPGTVNLAWNASSGATSYKIYYSTFDGPPYDTMIDTGAATTASLSGLTNGMTYYFAATASNAAGESGYSNEVSAMPSDPPPPDTTPPIVSITSPVDGGTVPRKGLVTITADASDDSGSVAYVTFMINGAVQCSTGTAPYRCAWRVPAAGGNRRYQLQAHAFDGANNVGYSTIVEVTAR